MGATVIGLLCHAGPMLNFLAKKVLDRTLPPLKKRGLDEDNSLAFIFFIVSAGPLSHRLNNHQSALDYTIHTVNGAWP